MSMRVRFTHTESCKFKIMLQGVWNNLTCQKSCFIDRASGYDSCKPTWRTVPFLICLFQFSTCFEQPRAHHQENQLHQYNIWYVSLCVGDRPVCSSGRKFLPDLHTRRSPTQGDTYQMLYWYNWFSWWWARGCSKHVEIWNKHIRKGTVRQVGYLQEELSEVSLLKTLFCDVVTYWPKILSSSSPIDHINKWRKGK
jgi:hypothetical protein